MRETEDWYPNTQEGERTMFENINTKIDGYREKYPFLTDDYLRHIHTMCRTYVEGYDYLMETRATLKQLSNWFTNIVKSKQKNQNVPAPPVFRVLAIVAEAMIGLEQQCRKLKRLLKAQPNYDFADGLDLMLEKEKSAERNLNDVVPELKISVSSSGVVMVEWKKTGFDMLELQWRRVGDAMWQPADKSTEKLIDFTPPLTEPGVPEKFEFRAIHLIKNQRVGKWSPIYTETVG